MYSQYQLSHRRFESTHFWYASEALPWRTTYHKIIFRRAVMVSNHPIIEKLIRITTACRTEKTL